MRRVFQNANPTQTFAELPVEVHIDASGETVESVASSQDGYSTGGSVGDDHEYRTVATAMEEDFEHLQADEMLIDNNSNTSNGGDSPIQTRGGIKQANVPPSAGIIGRDYAPNMPVGSPSDYCLSLELTKFADAYFCHREYRRFSV